jgi:beta-fructofuranosidase
VFQYAEVDGVSILLFCCGWRELSSSRLKELGKIDATYSLVVDQGLSDLDFTKATAFTDTVVYAGRLVQKPSGEWYLLGFLNDAGGKFVGELSNPIPVTADPHMGIIARS